MQLSMDAVRSFVCLLLFFVFLRLFYDRSKPIMQIRWNIIAIGFINNDILIWKRRCNMA